MSTAFLSHNLWPQLTKAARDSKYRSAVAVAYFGKGASSLLPLDKGSRLVVDASERAVTSGQTCPADLIKLVKRGVAVYSVPNLHAKVFVFGRAAYIGSTNISNRSAHQLVEAAVRTTEPSAVHAAREFVGEHCLHELTPEVLKRLVTLYRPPQVPGGDRGERLKKDTSGSPTLPRLLLAQIVCDTYSESEQTLVDAGMPAARKRRKHPRSFEVNHFIVEGTCRYQRGDVIIQVVDQGRGSTLVAPPGNVLHVESRQDGNRRTTVVYVERRSQRRRQLKSLARSLGRGAKKRLNQDGVIRDAAFKQALLKMLASKATR